MLERMQTLFDTIKEDEWVWMEQMVAFQEKVVPGPLRENPVTEKLLATTLVVGLVPAGLASLLRNL